MALKIWIFSWKDQEKEARSGKTLVIVVKTQVVLSGRVIFKCPSKPWQCDCQPACTITRPWKRYSEMKRGFFIWKRGQSSECRWEKTNNQSMQSALSTPLSCCCQLAVKCNVKLYVEMKEKTVKLRSAYYRWIKILLLHWLFLTSNVSRNVFNCLVVSL